MNSIFNQSSSVLAHMTDDELVSWLHSEGFAAMPPIVRTLADRLETACAERQTLEEELGDEIESLEKKITSLGKEVCAFSGEFKDGLNELDDELEAIAKKVNSAAGDLELSELGVLRDGEVICKEALNDMTEKELAVIPQRQLDAIRAVLNAAGKSLNERCIGDYFPDIPEI